MEGDEPDRSRAGHILALLHEDGVPGGGPLAARVRAAHLVDNYGRSGFLSALNVRLVESVKFVPSDVMTTSL